MGEFFKILPNLSQNWQNWVILLKIWPEIEQIDIWMGYFFLKNWYLYGSTFKFCCGTSLLKPNLSTPPLPVSNAGFGIFAVFLIEGLAWAHCVHAEF